MSAPLFTTTTEWRQRPLLRSLFDAMLILGISAILVGVALGPIHIGPRWIPSNVAMQQCRIIGLAMYSYANDNDQQYPAGGSSAEVFQKLIDGEYVSDPTVFYLPMPGKVKPVVGQKLKPENVSWDVTSGVDMASSDDIPLIFMTGYKVSYAPGGTAMPLIKPYPRFGWVKPNPTWLDWLLGRPTIQYTDEGGLAAFYKSNLATFLKLPPHKNADGSMNYPLSYDPATSVPNFISPDYKPDGRTYRQLTPEGILP